MMANRDRYPGVPYNFFERLEALDEPNVLDTSQYPEYQKALWETHGEDAYVYWEQGEDGLDGFEARQRLMGVIAVSLVDMSDIESVYDSLLSSVYTPLPPDKTAEDFFRKFMKLPPKPHDKRKLSAPGDNEERPDADSSIGRQAQLETRKARLYSKLSELTGTDLSDLEETGLWKLGSQPLVDRKNRLVYLISSLPSGDTFPCFRFDMHSKQWQIRELDDAAHRSAEIVGREDSNYAIRLIESREWSEILPAEIAQVTISLKDSRRSP